MSELRDRIKEIIDGSDVALFMKGTPEFIMCGNSDRASPRCGRQARR